MGNKLKEKLVIGYVSPKKEENSQSLPSPKRKVKPKETKKSEEEKYGTKEK